MLMISEGTHVFVKWCHLGTCSNLNVKKSPRKLLNLHFQKQKDYGLMKMVERQHINIQCVRQAYALFVAPGAAVSFFPPLYLLHSHVPLSIVFISSHPSLSLCFLSSLPFPWSALFPWCPGPCSLMPFLFTLKQKRCKAAKQHCVWPFPVTD